MLTIVLSFCRLAILLLGLFGTASSKAPPEDFTPYESNGPIVGDFTDVKSFPPKVVLNYLATCANVPIADPDGCLVSTFTKLRVPFDVDGTFACDSCEYPPNATDAVIITSALEAQAACVAMGEAISISDTVDLIQQYKTIAKSTCWNYLRDDDSYLFVEAKWIKTCADTKLPYPIPEDDMNMFMTETVQHRSILTCMLDRVFETDPTIFGLEATLDGSPESCFAPGYDNITSTCPSVLGPKTLRKCLNGTQRDDDGSIPKDHAMSMDYSGNSKAIFVEEFCGFLEALSTDVGRGCLLDLCEFDPTPSPSFSPVPSVEPSTSAPSTTPSTSAPSTTPSSKPSTSAMRSSVPSSSPSAKQSTSVGFCFPGSSTVSVKGKGMIALHEVKLGDEIMVEKDIYEPIYSFGHYSREVQQTFVKIVTTKTTLEITDEHMVFSVHKGIIPASAVQIGDELVDSDGQATLVNKIESVVRQGTYAPFTPSGKLIVDGITVSSYVAFQESAVLKLGGSIETPFSYHWMAHAFNFPHRFYCQYAASCTEEQYTEDGVSTWVAVPLRVSKWVLRQNTVVMALCMTVLIAGFSVLAVLETMPLTILAILGGYYYVSRAMTAKKQV